MKGLNFQIEKQYWQKKLLVIGVDEVGRGALAGPLVVAGVCFPPKIIKTRSRERFLINDSKKISPLRREKLAIWIKKNCLFYSITQVSHQIIDQHGISFAFETGIKEVFKKIIEKTKRKNLVILVDGYLPKRNINLKIKDRLINQKGIIKGDCLCFSIAASSIIAKVYRDRLMKKLNHCYPAYRWDKNKGYGTKDHREAIKKNGISRVHRKRYLKHLTSKN